MFSSLCNSQRIVTFFLDFSHFMHPSNNEVLLVAFYALKSSDTLAVFFVKIYSRYIYTSILGKH